MKTMETYCVSCKKNTDNENSSVLNKIDINALIVLFVARKKQSPLKSRTPLSSIQQF